MSRFDFKVDPDFLRALGKLEDINRIAPMMLNESLPILQRKMKSEFSKHTQTGELVNSIKIKKAGKTRFGGYYGSVRPTGTRKERGGYLRKGKRAGRKKVSGGTRDFTRNMELAAYLEFGTSKQPASPCITSAVYDSEDEVQGKMQEVFKREVSG